MFSDDIVIDNLPFSLHPVILNEVEIIPEIVILRMSPASSRRHVAISAVTSLPDTGADTKKRAGGPVEYRVKPACLQRRNHVADPPEPRREVQYYCPQ